jgi:hypothetical protein
MALDFRIAGASVRCISRVASLLLAGAVLALPAATQSSAIAEPPPTSAAGIVLLLDVVVSEPCGSVISNATTRLTNQMTNARIEPKTDGRGLARFLDIPAATYTIEVAKLGFETERMTNVKLLTGQASGIDFHLLVRQQKLDGPFGAVTWSEVLCFPLSSRGIPPLVLGALPPSQDASPKKH